MILMHFLNLLWMETEGGGSGGGGGGGATKEDIILELGADIYRKLPPQFDMEFAAFQRH